MTMVNPPGIATLKADSNFATPNSLLKYQGLYETVPIIYVYLSLRRLWHHISRSRSALQLLQFGRLDYVSLHCLCLSLLLQLLQRLLDDRRPTVELIKTEGQKLSELADSNSVEKQKIGRDIQNLGQRWDALLKNAESR